MRLSAEGLGCERGGRQVFADLSFALEGGSALVVEGPNGAGKSTLLRVIAGLLAPSAGSLRLEGGDEEASVGQQSHYLGHLDALKPALSVGETIGFWATFLTGSDEGGGHAEEALRHVRLDHLVGLPTAFLSAGQKRRLALARLVAAPRAVWLLDEPTVSLDARAKSDLEAACAQHMAGGGLIVAATHLPIELEPSTTFRLEGQTV